HDDPPGRAGRNADGDRARRSRGPVRRGGRPRPPRPGRRPPPPHCLSGGARRVAGLNPAGSAIAIEDLAAPRALVLPPLGAAFRDLHVSVVPPNSQGFVLLEILSLLERLGADAAPHGPEAGTIALVFAAAARDRDRH